MDRKESLKTLLLGTASLPFFKSSVSSKTKEEREGEDPPAGSEPMRSRWSAWPDMPWVGPAFWGNRLQDWSISGGKAECNFMGPNRTLHCLTHQLDAYHGHFTTRVEAEILNETKSGDDYAGFRLGARAEDDPCPVTFTDYRRAAVYGEGLDAGITGEGRLFIGEETSEQTISPPGEIRLKLEGVPAARSYKLVLSAVEVSSGEQVDRMTVENIDPEALVGNAALVSHFSSDGGDAETPAARFSDWRLSGSKVRSRPGQVYGPVVFAQYTLDREVLKLTAQLTPIETIGGHSVSLQIRDGEGEGEAEEGGWTHLQETTVDELSRTAHFRLEGWSREEDVPYRIRVELPLGDQIKEYFYEGTIAANPVSAEQLKAAVFSCNQEHGFPDNEVVENVSKHQPDMAMFLGDQFYESFGGFGVDRSQNVERATLDYLRKWYMFGWSYRDIFRHIPSVFIPDDHDVFHGNVWGQGGKAAEVDKGYGSPAQDTGGYQMPAEWVKMVQRTQTSHLPDPYDPTPVDQDIGVYYTDWNYGGISFAILEDRKFKTAPGNVLPVEVANGFVQDPDFDIAGYRDMDAELLGDRQEQFLEEWVADWSQGAEMKVVLSQSPFCGAHTLPEGATSDRIVPQRPIPARSDYPSGDTPARDMDTNGWPMDERDQALEIIRKGFALHIAGDQHLASVIKYGVEEYGDSGFVYTLPALNNTWPRRWYPTLENDHRSLQGKPKYTGNFKDAFDNRITVFSVANPVQTNRKPAIIYDRATGYGIVTFDKTDRTARLECWPRYVDPQANPEGQYDGWPMLIDQKNNYERPAAGYLPELQVRGLADPVVQVFNQDEGQLEYALRIKGSTFTPSVYAEGSYTVRVGDPDRDTWQEYENLNPAEKGEVIRCDFT